VQGAVLAARRFSNLPAYAWPCAALLDVHEGAATLSLMTIEPQHPFPRVCAKFGEISR
jgi:hypothetical protein